MHGNCDFFTTLLSKENYFKITHFFSELRLNLGSNGGDVEEFITTESPGQTSVL